MSCPAVVLILLILTSLVSNSVSAVDSTEQVIDTLGSGNVQVVTVAEDKLDNLINLVTAIQDALVSINNLLYRLNEYADYIVAFVVVIALCILYYRYLEYFTRF